MVTDQLETNVKGMLFSINVYNKLDNKNYKLIFPTYKEQMDFIKSIQDKEFLILGSYTNKR